MLMSRAGRDGAAGAAGVPRRAVRGGPRAAGARPATGLPVGLNARPAGIISFYISLLKL